MAQPSSGVVVIGGSGSYLGVGVAEINAERARALNLKEEHGVEITKVDDESAAAKAGLKEHDVVLSYNGQRVEGTEQFIRYVRETPPGREVKLLISRNGATQTVAATISQRKNRVWSRGGDFHFEMPEIRVPDVPNVFTSWRSGMLGIEAESLSPQLAEFFGVKDGVLIRSVMKNSPAEKAGLKAGDVLIKVDDKAVSSPQEVTRAVRGRDGKKTLPLTLYRDRREMTLSVTLEDDETGPKPGRGRAVRLRNEEL
jgi:serine protease Do